jgi:uncharacterized repeat protein (TIGR04076 family)
MHDVIIEVVEVKESCPVYKVGDYMYVCSTKEGAWVIDTERSGAKCICVSALPALVGEMIKVREGLKDCVFVHCLDPGPPFTPFSAIFCIKRAK